MKRRRIDRAKKVAYVCAALFPDCLSIDAAEMVASRAGEIDGAVVAEIRERIGGGY